MDRDTFCPWSALIVLVMSSGEQDTGNEKEVTQEKTYLLLRQDGASERWRG